MSEPVADLVQVQIEEALARHQAGAIAEAEQRYRQILVQAPEHPIAWHLLGATLHQQQRSQEAAACIERALALRPDEPVFLANLGEVYRVLRRFEEALAVIERSLALRGEHAETHYKLGLVQCDRRQSDLAMAHFQRALQLDPHHADAWNNWGCELTRNDRTYDAIPLFNEALRLRPEFPLAENNLGAALSLVERSHEALPHYRRALELDPLFREAHSNLLFALNYESSLDPDELFAAHEDFGRRHFQSVMPATLMNDRSPARRLRIGYVSGDLRRHPVACFIEPILREHDRQQYEVVVYDDNPRPDNVTRRLEGLADRWTTIAGEPDDDLIERVIRDEIDILVDLAGHTTRNRMAVFAQRAAPVQVTYLGYVNTTGLTTMDYRITDAVCDPPGEPTRHTEQLLRLPRMFCTYQPPDDAPPVSTLPAIKRRHVTFGSLHNLAKLGPTTFDLWAGVLRAVPTAHLRIIRGVLTDELQQRFTTALVERGVNIDRLEFARCWADTGHWSCYHDIDISLDVVPWSGHTTACESLWMGVPMVTLYGNRHAGRMVSSVLNAVGLSDWIARTAEEYVTLAASMAADLGKLAALREQLRSHLAASPLCDTSGFTKELENAYRTMWQAWRAASTQCT